MANNEQEPRERRRRGHYKPTISALPASYNPVTESLAEALLREAGLPIGETMRQVDPDTTSVPLDYRTIQRRRRKGARLY